MRESQVRNESERERERERESMCVSQERERERERVKNKIYFTFMWSCDKFGNVERQKKWFAFFIEQERKKETNKQTNKKREREGERERERTICERDVRKHNSTQRERRGEGIQTADPLLVWLVARLTGGNPP